MELIYGKFLSDLILESQKKQFNEIMINLTKSENFRLIRYTYNDIDYIVLDKVTNEYNINYEFFWKIFEYNYMLNYTGVSELLHKLLSEHFSCEIGQVNT